MACSWTSGSKRIVVQICYNDLLWYLVEVCGRHPTRGPHLATRSDVYQHFADRWRHWPLQEYFPWLAPLFSSLECCFRGNKQRISEILKFKLRHTHQFYYNLKFSGTRGPAVPAPATVLVYTVPVPVSYSCYYNYILIILIHLNLLKTTAHGTE